MLRGPLARVFRSEGHSMLQLGFASNVLFLAKADVNWCGSEFSFTALHQAACRKTFSEVSPLRSLEVVAFTVQTCLNPKMLKQGCKSEGLLKMNFSSGALVICHACRRFV